MYFKVFTQHKFDLVENNITNTDNYRCLKFLDKTETTPRQNNIDMQA